MNTYDSNPLSACLQCARQGGEALLVTRARLYKMKDLNFY